MRAKRSLGQNFLRDVNVSERIIAALDLKADDTVIEIGPGQGALTELILGRVGKVAVIEFDRELIGPLTQMFPGRTDLEIINADALEFDFARLAPLAGRSKLVANLPYNISTPILQRLISHRQLFERLVLMFQREVVDRITAGPATSSRGYLSVLVEDAFTAERLFDVPPDAFWPVPKVWSSVVRLYPKAGDRSNDAMAELLSRAFAQKRKTLLNNLKGYYKEAEAMLEQLGIDPRRRAETLSLAEWHALKKAVSES